MTKFFEKMESLSISEQKRVLEFLAAIRTPVKVQRNEQSKIVSDLFLESFNSMLLSQHVMLCNPLFQDAFERAFIESCIYAEHKVKKVADGQRFYDVTLNGENTSLKSTKEKNLRKSHLKISKLTEAAWIQDCRSARQRREKTFELFEEYVSKVKSIYQLRYFSEENTYELVEFRTFHFKDIMDAPLEAFNADGPSISIPYGSSDPDFTLKLDRSDAKITINNIRIESCIIHCTWVIGK